MKHYFITLLLYIGGYEKRTHCIVSADDEESAKAYALYGESHNTNDLTWIDAETVEDDYMRYEIDGIKEISDDDTDTLDRIGIPCLNVYEKDLEESNHPDYQGE